MKRRLYSFKGILKIIFGLIIVFIILLRLEIIGQPMMNMSFRYSDKKLLKQFREEERIPEIKYQRFGGRSLRYLEMITDSKLPYVVFVHGAPGSLADYLDYFKNENLYTKTNLISIDRLGYGNSDFGDAETSIQIQADAIQSIIEKVTKNHNNDHSTMKVVIVGHSYGGPIAAKMAMDFNGFYDGILLLAPALDPENEKEIKLARLPMKQPIRWLTPPALRVAADEKITHISELKKLVSDYDKIKTPICHIHGDQDSLVPYENLAFSMKKINPEYLDPVSLENVDHFLPWSHHDLIVDKILEMTSTANLPSN